MSTPLFKVVTGVDFGNGEFNLPLIAFYDPKEVMWMFSQLALVIDGARVVTSFPSMGQTRMPLEWHYRVFYRNFNVYYKKPPLSGPWVRKGRHKTKRGGK